MKTLIEYLAQDYYFAIYLVFAISTAITLSSILSAIVYFALKLTRSAEVHVIVSSFLLAIACISGAIIYQEYAKSEEDLMSKIKIVDVHDEEIEKTNANFVKTRDYSQTVSVASISDEDKKFKSQQIAIKPIAATNNVLVTTEDGREFRIKKEKLDEVIQKENK